MLIARLQLEPHPEGGWYREVHRSGTLLDTPRGPRAALTSIYFLLEQHQHAGEWQAARSSGEWSLVGCDVGPGFDFEDFSFVTSIAGHEAAFTGDLAPYSRLL